MAKRGRPRLNKPRKTYCPSIVFTGSPVSSVIKAHIENEQRKRFSEMVQRSQDVETDQELPATPFSEHDRQMIRSILNDWHKEATPDDSAPDGA